MLVKGPISRVAVRVSATSKKSVAGPPFRRPHRLRRDARRVVTMAVGDELVTSYASALASLAESEGKLERIHDDMDRLATVVRDFDNLPEFLANPLVEWEERREVLDTVCKESGFDEITENFINLVVDSGRADLFEEICQIFEVQYCNLTDTQVAVLTTATQLTDDEQFEVAKKLQELSGAKNIKLKPVLDTSLLGGFIVEFGSRQIDVSVRGQLNEVGFELNENGVSATQT